MSKRLLLLLPILALFAASHGGHRKGRKTANDHVEEAEGWSSEPSPVKVELDLDAYPHPVARVLPRNPVPRPRPKLDVTLRDGHVVSSESDRFNSPIGRTLTEEWVAEGKPVPSCALKHVPAGSPALEKLSRSAGKRRGMNVPSHQTSPEPSNGGGSEAPKGRPTQKRSTRSAQAARREK